MITGELRNQIDRIWDAFWSGGISNPLEVMERLTYLLFLRRPASAAPTIWSVLSARATAWACSSDR